MGMSFLDLFNDDEPEGYMRVHMQGEDGLRWALNIAKAGHRVMPVQAKSKLPLYEAAPNGADSGTTDEETIRGWSEKGWGGKQLALCLDGLVVLDIDSKEGLASLRKLEAELGPLPPTRFQSTSRGWHLIFRLPPGYTVKNGKKRLGSPDGIDVKSGGSSYIVCHPSEHPKGGDYAFYRRLHDEGLLPPIAMLPLDWAIRLMPPPRSLKKASGKPVNLNGADCTARGQGVLLHWVRHAAYSVEGTRNNNLRDAAFAVGSWVALGHIDYDAAYRCLVQAGLDAGLDEREAEELVERKLAEGMDEPMDID